MNKINAIVFSYDNAAQLNIFLDSIKKHAKDVFNINVIINSSENFKDGYDIVKNKFKSTNFFSQENDFKKQVLELIGDGEYSCFFLDDDILYKDVEFKDIETQFFDDDVVCFSLRLGENVTKCYTLDVDNVMHDIKKDGKTMKWDWKLHYLDFGYPFAMNGHVFRRKDIYKLVRKSKFLNVDELEVALYEFAEIFPRNLMTSYINSVLVNVPIGRVQKSIESDAEMINKKSESRIARKKMNKLFVDGDFIEFKSISFSNIEGCHQELDFGIYVELSSVDKVSLKKFGKIWEETTEEEKNEIDDIFDKLEEIIKNKENE